MTLRIRSVIMIKVSLAGEDSRSSLVSCQRRTRSLRSEVSRHVLISTKTPDPDHRNSD